MELAFGEESLWKAPLLITVKAFVLAFTKATDGLPRPRPATRPVEGPDHSEASNLADERTRIADLHERGLLSSDEFAAAKAKLLD